MIKFYYFGTSKKSKRVRRKERKKGGREERKENDFIRLLQSFILTFTKKQTLNIHYKSPQIPEEWKEKSFLGFIIGWPHIPSNMLRHCFISDSEGRLTHKYHFTTQPFIEVLMAKTRSNLRQLGVKRSDEFMAQGRMAADVW